MRSGVHSRLMMRTLLTPLWMPYAAWARASSSGKAYSSMRRSASSRSGTIFCVPTTRMTFPAPDDVRAELAATHGGGHQRPGLGDGVDTAEHDVGRGAEAADLVGLRRAVHAEDPWSERLVSTGPLDLIGDARRVERLRRALMHLRPGRDEIQDDAFGFRAVPARGATVIPLASSAAAVRLTRASSAGPRIDV